MLSVLRLYHKTEYMLRNKANGRIAAVRKIKNSFKENPRGQKC